MRRSGSKSEICARRGERNEVGEIRRLGEFVAVQLVDRGLNFRGDDAARWHVRDVARGVVSVGSGHRSCATKDRGDGVRVVHLRPAVRAIADNPVADVERD